MMGLSGVLIGEVLFGWLQNRWIGWSGIDETDRACTFSD